MNKPVSVSIIMGVYNPKSPKRFIQALESIQRQSFFDWELLVYDDGSAEPYQKIIRRAGRLDERIRCLRGMENRGLAHALNVCIRQAAGRFIARMDDDDLAKPDRLEKQVAFLDLNPYFAGEDGQLPAEASTDGIHLRKAYCEQWLEYLKAHTVSYETLYGTEESA